jgi:hypothetical protein
VRYFYTYLIRPSISFYIISDFQFSRTDHHWRDIIYRTTHLVHQNVAKWPRYREVISLEIQVRITSQINNGLTRTPGNAGGGIRCLEGVGIPCRPVAPAVSHFHLSWMRSYPLSKSVCQVRPNYWDENRMNFTYNHWVEGFAGGLYDYEGLYSPVANYFGTFLKIRISN